MTKNSGISLVKYLSPELILTDIKASDKWNLMKQMLDALVESPGFLNQPHISRDKVWSALVDREEKQSTGVGDGVAFPHCRIPDYQGLGVCLAFLKEPVDFDSIDDKPANVACMMLIPESEPVLALRLFSKLSELLMDEAIRGFFATAEDGTIIYEYLRKKEISVETSLRAQDIMRTHLLKINPDTPLSDVAHLMMRNRVEAAVVLDGEGEIAGQITCDNLFQYGLPDFFNQLQSVAFISEFDPFEKYFADESRAFAKDVMSQDYVTVPPTATLLEIVFALTVRKQPKVYVVKDSKCIGVIDRTTVLDRILNI
ncbi:MAG: PTS sugar transporter subunit IIA [Candidatus Coatesbacteria bacterium]|nr:PTS sugar transporter subunit IIA [Candidatus Coatesbacteria bacterium]